MSSLVIRDGYGNRVLKTLPQINFRRQRTIVPMQLNKFQSIHSIIPDEKSEVRYVSGDNIKFGRSELSFIWDALTFTMLLNEDPKEPMVTSSPTEIATYERWERLII